MSLEETMLRLNVVKQEHISDEQRNAGARAMGEEDLETIALLLAGTGVSGDDVAVCGTAVVLAICRDIRRQGILRGARQSDLRAVLFAAYFDGLLTGLHHREQG